MVRAVFSSTGGLTGGRDDSLVGLTDLTLVTDGADTTLFAVSRGDGYLSAFDIGAATGQTRFDGEYRLPARFLQLESTELVTRQTTAGPEIYMAGLADDALQGLRLDLDAGGTPIRGAVTAQASGWDLGTITEMSLFDGGSAGVAALRSGGLVNVSFTPGGSLNVRDLSRPGYLDNERASDVITTNHNGQTYAFASYGRAEEVSLFRLENGTMRHMADASIDEGLWTNRPGAMTVATDANGDLFVVVAGSRSDSLSVLQVSSDGRDITPVDHLIDSLDTRFANASHVTSVTVGGRDFILAAGSDQGISLFTMLPGGRLQHIDAMAGTAGAPLRGITSLEAMATPQGIRVWAATQSAPFLAEFNVALTSLGNTLQANTSGGALTGMGRDDLLIGDRGADVLNGGGGDDIIVDGAGSDRMSGGSGADTFVLIEDGQRDVITDFDRFNDRIDLTDFNQLNGIGGLSISSTSWGANLRFGDELVEVRSVDGNRLSLSDFTPQNLVQGNRIETDPSLYPTAPSGPDPEPDPNPNPNPDPDPEPGGGGTPVDGSATTPPVAPPRFSEPQVTLERRSGDFLGSNGGDAIRTFGQDDRLFGNAGNDTIRSGAGADSVSGDGGNDDIHGGGESDLILGGAGFDTITGGDGDDTISGGTFADSLMGSDGNDVILGGDGFDQIFGGAHDDRIWAGSSADRVFGGDGNDWISAGSNFGFSVDGIFGEGGNDTLFGDAGFDLLNGGDGDDVLDGGHQADNLYGEAGNDILLGGLGFDRLFGGTGDDQLYGGASGDGLFGQEGDDRMWGGSGDDRFFGGSGNDVLDGGTGNDTINGDSGFDTLNGGAGNDILTGSFNADHFEFADGHGNDTITDFDALNDNEAIDFSDLSSLNSIDAVLAASSQSGDDTVITTGSGSSIRLSDVARSDLDENDFVF